MIYKAVAQTNLTAPPHSWTKGLDYQVVEKEDYFILASNEGSINYVNDAKKYVFERFNVIK